MQGLKNSQGLSQCNFMANFLLDESQVWNNEKTYQIFTGVKWLNFFLVFLPLFFFSSLHRRGGEKTRKEGTKTKVCFGMNEVVNLLFQMAKLCLHFPNKKVSPWSNFNKMPGVFNGNTVFGSCANRLGSMSPCHSTALSCCCCVVQSCLQWHRCPQLLVCWYQILMHVRRRAGTCPSWICLPQIHLMCSATGQCCE